MLISGPLCIIIIIININQNGALMVTVAAHVTMVKSQLTVQDFLPPALPPILGFRGGQV